MSQTKVIGLVSMYCVAAAVAPHLAQHQTGIRAGLSVRNTIVLPVRNCRLRNYNEHELSEQHAYHQRDVLHERRDDPESVNSTAHVDKAGHD